MRSIAVAIYAGALAIGYANLSAAHVEMLGSGANERAEYVAVVGKNNLFMAWAAASVLLLVMLVLDRAKKPGAVDKREEEK